MKRYLLFFLIFFLAIFIGRNFSFFNYFQLIPQAKADNATTSVYVCTSVCGDGTKECLEECDDGNTNDGDGCDHNCKIEPTTTTTSPPSTTSTTLGGGGGGGGGGGFVPSERQVTFSGKAYPKSTVTLLKDAQVVATTIADSNANFFITLSNINTGSYIFSVYSEDQEGNRSALLTFPVSVTDGVTTNIQKIFIAPTIDTDKIEVKKGEVVKIFGQSAPNSEIIVIISSEEELYGKTKADNAGAYLYNLDTVEVAMGDHLTKSRATLENDISSLSKTVSFKVGTKTVLRPITTKCSKADLNCDGRVNLVDFSIAAYWYKRALSIDFKTIEAERLNGDAKIDLVDFSIMAYYWTG
ncbi:MAG: DUF4215 domain-containing protein [Parcubacteria group bacterium]|nr:DUF4215 domain-containing protein [Parcubacteria group bacterium]